MFLRQWEGMVLLPVLYGIPLCSLGKLAIYRTVKELAVFYPDGFFTCSWEHRQEYVSV
jgi:hypothetical protein